MNKYCTNCGQPLKPNDKACGNCGAAINSSKSQLSKKKKKNWLIGSIIGGILIIGIIIGANYYSENNQIRRIVTALTTHSDKLKNYVVADNPNIKVTANSLKPLQTDYQYSDNEVKRALQTYLAKSLKNPNEKANLQLVKTGRYFLLFPKYSLRLRTYSPTINTDDDNDKLYVNGSYEGRLKYGSKKLSNIFPGTYDIEVEDKDKKSTTKTAYINNDAPIFIDVKTYSVKIKGFPNSKIYLNGYHQAGDTLDEDGEYVSTFYKGEDTGKSSNKESKKDANEQGELYLTAVVDGKTVKSKPIKGFVDQLSDFNIYGESSSGVIKWSDDKDVDYEVTPKWDKDVEDKLDN